MNEKGKDSFLKEIGQPHTLADACFLPAVTDLFLGSATSLLSSTPFAFDFCCFTGVTLGVCRQQDKTDN